MAKKKSRRRRNRFTLPISVVAPVAYVGYNTFLYAVNQGPDVALDKLGYWFTGYSVKNADWNWTRMKGGLFPVLAGAIVHKVANIFGLNRMIARAGVPLIRI